MSKKIGKDVIGKGKRAGVIRTKKEQEDFEEYKRRKAQEEKEKEEKKKVGSEKMPEEREPTVEQLAKQKAEVLADIEKHRAETKEEGKTVHVDEHYRHPPGETEEESEDEEEEEPSKKEG